MSKYWPCCTSGRLTCIEWLPHVLRYSALSLALGNATGTSEAAILSEQVVVNFVAT